MIVGFMQVRSPSALFRRLPVCCCRLQPVLSPGGPVPQVGVTIAMDDQVLNGTNRVVLDGVMTEKECERILYLANVSSEQERPFVSKTLRTHTLARFPACFR